MLLPKSQWMKPYHKLSQAASQFKERELLQACSTTDHLGEEKKYLDVYKWIFGTITYVYDR